MRWFLKKMMQYQLEKTMEEAPKGSVLGAANTARVVLQNYDVKINDSNSFSAGYDLPTNKAKIGMNSTIGNHFLNVDFNEGDFGPRNVSGLYYNADKKVLGTRFINRYSILDTNEF